LVKFYQKKFLITSWVCFALLQLRYTQNCSTSNLYCIEVCRN